MSELLGACLVLKIFLMLHQFFMRMNLSEAPFTYGIHAGPRDFFIFIHMTATLGINNRVSDTLGINVELKITSQVNNLINQILSFLENGGSSAVKTLNQTSFHMRRMARLEVEVSASVGGFGRQSRPLPDDHNIQNVIRTV
jgi:hypothetical protein